MKFNYIILILIMIGILVGFVFYKLIKYCKYELHFKESVLYSIQILIISVFGLIDYSLIKQNLRWNYLTAIAIYFLIILFIYYILRFIKLKKFIPFKSIISYILMTVANLVILFNFFTNELSNISGWNILGVILSYILIDTIFIVLLLTLNIIFSIIKLATKTDTNYNNVQYKISKFSYLNIFAIILLIILIFMINYYNRYQYDKLVEKQKITVINYLNKEYPNYEFEIIDTKEIGINCWMFGCKEQAFDNNILNKDYNCYFSIYIRKEDLTIYDDHFKEIINEKLEEGE